MAADGSDRRSIVLAGVGVFGAILVLVAIAVLADGGAGDPVATTASTVACAPDDAACRASQRSGDRPGIIPEPGTGQAAAEPGEPGGWEQLALLGVILAAVAVIAAVVVRSARRSRRGTAGPPADDGTAVRASP
ncbi:MAG TPA: hypothetical protein VEW93_09525 [Acidimicrobiales bacterium]|nr:hypothetical protein [Acidimicrobiales bacterium]